MRPVLMRYFCAGLLIFSTGCENVLETFADKKTNAALYEDAMKLMNSGDYSGAIAKIALMTGEYATSRTVVTLKASAYAGICGLNFLNFVEALQGMGTKKLFTLLIEHFRGGSPLKIDSCLTAENLIESIGSVTDRTSDENMFLVLISFAKIGVILSLYADADNDGLVTASYDSCTVGTVGARAAGSMTDYDARELGTGLTLAMANISAVTSSVDLGDASLTSLQSSCSSLPAAYNFCSITDPDAFTATMVKGIRSFVRESSSIGLGTCTGDVVTCACP